MAEAQPALRQSSRFLILYSLAAAGGAVAYVPFLTLLLPLQATTLAGTEALNLVSYTAFFGAVAASLANILFGWLSDRTRNRVRWIWAGLILSSLLLLLMPLAQDSVPLISLIVAWQVALNMMLAPLSAWAGDHVPDAQKGLLGGLLAFTPAVGALSGAVITLVGGPLADMRHGMVAGLVVLMVAPALLFGQPRFMPNLLAPDRTPVQRNLWGFLRSGVSRMWLARLCVQVAEASLFAFLLLWFQSLKPDIREQDVASLFSLTLLVAVGFTLWIGRWSDRAGQPILPLTVCAAISGVGLVLMAVSSTLAGAITGYVVFGLSGSMFLALHNSQTLRVLPRPQNRGRDLGLFNLTNTVPSLLMPWMALSLATTQGFSALFWLLSGLAMVASLLLLTLRPHSSQ
ncbi:MAG: MFS transporter [Asticcacaulis sp.]